VYVMDLPNTFNSIIYATAQSTDIQNLYDNYLYLKTRPNIHPLLLDSIQRVVANQQPLPNNPTVFTDDRAPIEWITNNMVLNFVLFGNMKEIQ